MPWANDGGGAWNATRCSPIAAKPASIGEPCHVDGSGVSGLDDCELASMCWDVDPETNEGTCVPLCVGHPAFPLCEDPTRACRQAAGGVLNLCLETCHPVLQNCPEGRRCTYDWNAFYCEPDLSHGGGTLNSPCYAGTCAPGYECMAAPPNLCSGSEACCRPFCEVGTLGPPCAATEECVPWFGDGKAPARLEDVGYCAFPEL